MAWLNGHQSHFTMVGGQQSARSLAASRRTVPARRRRRPAARSRAGGARGCARCSRCTASSDDAADELRPIPRCCRSTRRHVRAQWRCPRSSAGLRGTAFAASRRGATRSRRPGSTTARARIRDAGLDRHRPLPRRHVSRARPRRPPARAHRRQSPRGRRGARRSARDASCSSSAACRRTATARSCRAIWPARAKWCATASATAARIRARRRHARSRSSRCIRCMPPTARA